MMVDRVHKGKGAFRHHGMTFNVSSVATTWTGPAIKQTRCALWHTLTILYMELARDNGVRSLRDIRESEPG